MKSYKKSKDLFACNFDESKIEQVVKVSDGEELKSLKQDSILKEKKKYQISPNFVLREIAGEYIIIPTGVKSIFSNTMMTPNDSAVFLWKAFEQPSTIDDVVARGMQEYDISEETIRKSVEQFVKESLECKILEEDD